MRLRWSAWVAGILLFLPASSFAIQQRQVEQVMPRGGTRGTTVEVLLQGMDLADPREVVFYRGGIEATNVELLPPPQYEVSLAHGGKIVEQVKVRFKIAPDCPLGEHPFRLRTGTTLGTLCTFWVGRFPIIDERENNGQRGSYEGENDTPARAQPVPLNVTIAGQIHPGPEVDVDLFRVELKAGQRLSVEVEALRLCMIAYGDAEHDLMIRILDPEGKVLARNDDSALHVQDPLLSYRAARDGSYLVEVRQRVFRHDSWGYYRIHIGTFVRPLVAYPAGGKAGERLSVRMLGDAAGDTTEVVAVPERLGTFSYFPGKPDEQPPSPLELRASPYGNVLEKEPNNDDGHATVVAGLPMALNGVVEKAGDVDEFRFPVKKGTRYRIRVFARSLGTPLDAKIWLRPVGAAADAIELEADDSQLPDRDLFAMSRSLRPKDLLDPSVVFAPKQAGEYVLGIGDTRSLGSPTSVYRVEIEPVSDSMFTYVASTAHDAFEVNRVTGFIVPRGNRWTINVLLAEGQGNGYQGDLELDAVGLPAGVEMIAPRVTKGLKMVPVQFVADSSVAEQVALIELVAKPVEAGVKLSSGSQQAVPFVNHSGGHAWHSVLLDKYALAVTNPAPFHIELVQPSIALAQSGELALSVRLVRHGGFKDAVDVQPDWLPPGVAGESAVTIGPGQSEAKFALHAGGNATPGSYKVAMNATTTGGLFYSGIGRVRTSSAFVDLAITAPYLTMNIQRTAIERGRRAEVVCDIQTLKRFPGRAVASLRGLPRGVVLREPLPTIAAGDAKAKFQVEATSDALVGQYSGIACEVTFEENGQAIRQQTGSGVLRVDPARSGNDASQKPR